MVRIPNTPYRLPLVNPTDAQIYAWAVKHKLVERAIQRVPQLHGYTPDTMPQLLRDWMAPGFRKIYKATVECYQTRHGKYSLAAICNSEPEKILPHVLDEDDTVSAAYALAQLNPTQ